MLAFVVGAVVILLAILLGQNYAIPILIGGILIAAIIFFYMRSIRRIYRDIEEQEEASRKPPIYDRLSVPELLETQKHTNTAAPNKAEHAVPRSKTPPEAPAASTPRTPPCTMHRDIPSSSGLPKAEKSASAAVVSKPERTAPPPKTPQTAAPSPSAPQKCTKAAVSLSTKKARQNLKDYVVLDFETTGLSPWDNEIIEASMVRYVDGEEEAVYSTLVNPLEPIPPRITKLTGISDADVADAPTMKAVIHDIQEFIGDLPIVAHNASFDVGFLVANYECRQIYRHIRYIDTLTLARKAFPDLPNHKLETLIREFHLAEAQTHRALDDVYCTQKVLMLCLEKLNQPKVKKEPPLEHVPAPVSDLSDMEHRIARTGYEANQIAMQYEKAGELENAIHYYEMSVAKNFSGSYPYERLAILYRKRKQYSEEIRICDAAAKALSGTPATEWKIVRFQDRKDVALKKLGEVPSVTSGSMTEQAETSS